MTHVFIAGYPGIGGGADVELWHLCDAFCKAGIGVHLVPFGEPDRDMREAMDCMGCFTHEYRPDVFAGQVVLSFCNGEFLRRLLEIHAAGAPKAVVWFDCMAKTTYGQEGLRLGLIDYFGFQSRYQYNNHIGELRRFGEPRILEGYRPFFSWTRGTEEGVWAPGCKCNRDPERFTVGRLSRDDYYKFPDNLWRDWGKIQSPKPVRIMVMGYGSNARSRNGEPPEGAIVHPPYAMPAADFISYLDVMIHNTGGSGENWPRVLFEAWANGVIPIFDRDSGAAEIIHDGEDGFLVRNGAEAAERASQIAQDDALRSRLVKAGYETLLREHCDAERSVGPFLPLLDGCPDAPEAARRTETHTERVQAISASLNRAVPTKRFAAAVFRVEDGQVHMDWHQHGVSPEDQAMAARLLAEKVSGVAPAVAMQADAKSRPCVIGVHTHPKSPMANTCRETWVPRASELGLEVLFYSGAEPCEACNGKRKFSQSGDLLQFPVPTDYAACSDRMDAWCKWLKVNRPEAWLFDVDDDTVVIPERLLAMLPSAEDYVGFPIDLGPGTPSYASGGAGMLLSPRAVSVIAERGLPNRHWAEDVEVGAALNAGGIELTHDNRFRPFRNSVPGDNNEPTRGNDFISGHCKSPGNDAYEERVALMRKIWKEVA